MIMLNHSKLSNIITIYSLDIPTLLYKYTMIEWCQKHPIDLIHSFSGQLLHALLPHIVYADFPYKF